MRVARPKSRRRAVNTEVQRSWRIDTMACCHADFAALEGSDRGFTLGMPTFTFGSGVLAEAGDNAVELGMKRIALFTDRSLASSEHVATVKSSLAAAGVDCVVYDEVRIERSEERRVGKESRSRRSVDQSKN